jgi:hypothetical protein
MKNFTPPAVPLWKLIAPIATMLVAAMLILAMNAYIGAALFITGVFLQTHGGFTSAPPIPGETRFRSAALAFAWIVLLALCVIMQAAVPQFIDVFKSFGADLPQPTMITMQAYPLLLLLPLLVALVWNCWPLKPSRLRAAVIVCWAGVGLTILMFASLYLPILKLGSVV